MKRTIGIAAAFCMLLPLTTIYGDDGSDPAAPFMHAKLARSQKILEGLATENYALIAENAQALTLLSQDAGWNVVQTAEYASQSELFRRNTRALTSSAKRRNLDGATLAFVRVTMNCVECHKHVRSVKHASLKEFGKEFQVFKLGSILHPIENY